MATVDCKEDGAVDGDKAMNAALPKSYNSISINKVKEIVRRKQKDRGWAGCVD